MRTNPKRGYGSAFGLWVQTGKKRPIIHLAMVQQWGFSGCVFFDTEKDVLDEAKKSADVTHNHSEGVKGAQSVALAIFMAKRSQLKQI